MTESNALADHVRLERCCAESPWGMVTTQHWLATQAGVSMLARGRNALDAAVAAAFTLGVVEPAASGLGGQTFATIFLMDGHRIVCLDGSSRAPNRTPPGAATDALAWTERLRGHRATTVPSTPAVLAYLLERYGCLGEAEILAPAIRCAREGYPISALQHALLVRELDTLQAQRDPTSGVFVQQVHECLPTRHPNPSVTSTPKRHLLGVGRANPCHARSASMARDWLARF